MKIFCIFIAHGRAYHCTDRAPLLPNHVPQHRELRTTVRDSIPDIAAFAFSEEHDRARFQLL